MSRRKNQPLCETIDYIKAFKNGKLKVEVSKYLRIQEKVKDIRVLDNSEFQDFYIKYYNVWHLGRDRYDGFFNVFKEYFEGYKATETICFDVIINSLYQELNIVTPCFASKILATINPDAPLWDSHVLKSLNVVACTNTDIDKRIKDHKELYKHICEWYVNYKESQDCVDVLSAFNQAFPEAQGISDTKKIDFILWALN